MDLKLVLGSIGIADIDETDIPLGCRWLVEDSDKRHAFSIFGSPTGYLVHFNTSIEISFKDSSSCEFDDVGHNDSFPSGFIRSHVPFARRKIYSPCMTHGLQ